jgi:hypothetical protein
MTQFYDYNTPVPIPRKLWVSLLEALTAVDPEPVALTAAHDLLLTWCSGYWAGISRLASPSQSFPVDESTPIPREMLDELLDAFGGDTSDDTDINRDRARDPVALDIMRDQLLAYLG